VKRPLFTVAWLLALAALLAGCHAAKLLAPPVPIQAASVNAFAVNVEFAEPLDRATAQDPARYRVHAAGTSAEETIDSATLVDTLEGRVVQLIITSGPLPDSAAYEVVTQGVRTYDGHDTGARRVTFQTGLGYGAHLRAVFAAHCDACHGASRQDGNYRTDSLAGLRGTGVDSTPDLIAGDPNCALARRTRPRKSAFDQGALSWFESDLIEDWVVGYDGRP
jgi:hypothetical protein